MRIDVVRSPIVLGLAVAACSAAPHHAARPGGDQEAARMAAASRAGSTPDDRFGPLTIGADYKTYRKLTARPFQSLDHGNRWVDVWVSASGADAYLHGTAVPIGTTIVKSSWENDHGRPSNVPGPLYIMQKRAKGYSPAHRDWYFAMYWANPTPAARKKLGGPIYWRGRSPKIAFCGHCHDSYDRELGGLTPSSLLPR